MKRIFLSIALLVLLGGCDPGVYLEAPLTRGVEWHPQLGEEAEAIAGSVLFGGGNFLSRQTAILSTNGKEAILSRKAKDGTETYCYGYARIVYYSSTDGKNFDRRKYDDGTIKQLSQPIPFTKDKSVNYSIKYELIFDGIEDKILKFTYKEYRYDMINPSYIQKLRFPVPALPSTIDLGKISYTVPQKAYGLPYGDMALNLPTIEVLSIHDNVIRYKVLSGFSSVS